MARGEKTSEPAGSEENEGGWNLSQAERLRREVLRVECGCGGG